MGTSIHSTREGNLNSKMHLLLFSLMLVSVGAVPSPVGSPVPSPVGSPVGSPVAVPSLDDREAVPWDRDCYQQSRTDPSVTCTIPCHGSTCPSIFDYMECPEGWDELGCPKTPTCSPRWLPDLDGDLTCSNMCPPVCDVHQQLCVVSDHSDPNCPDRKDYSCISDNPDPDPGTCKEYCPPDCSANEMPCKGKMDANYCYSASTCYPSLLPNQNGDLACYNTCPMVCEADQQLCEYPANLRDCPTRMMYSCISDNSDPAQTCKEYCPPPCTSDQVVCPGPTDENNCTAASTCADTWTDCPAI